MNAKTEKSQNDVITLSERFSLYRDQYQWFLYDFHDTRLKADGTPKKLPTPTYHPRLEQLVDHMVQKQARDAKVLIEIVDHVAMLSLDIMSALEGFLEPLGVTPADAAVKLRERGRLSSTEE